MNKHGMCSRTTKHPLYGRWSCMNQRCINPNNPRYYNYGGRGIRVCNEWKNDFVSFYKWCIANGWQKGLSIDRINVNGNYCPSNCRVATNKEQCNNTRRNIFVTYKGRTQTLTQWSEEVGLGFKTLQYRLQNWENIEDAFTTPKNIGKLREARYSPFAQHRKIGITLPSDPLIQGYKNKKA